MFPVCRIHVNMQFMRFLLRGTVLFYMFPHFSLLPRTYQKIEGQTNSILVAPVLPSQSWWPHLTRLIFGPCHLYPSSQKLLRRAHYPKRKHSLKKMTLAVFPISGDPSKSKSNQQKLHGLSPNLGEKAHENNMKHIFDSGFLFFFLSGGRNLIQLTIMSVITFLTSLYQRGLSHSLYS